MVLIYFLHEIAKVWSGFLDQKEIPMDKNDFKHLQSRFQFLILLIIFLPMLTNALYSGSASQLEANTQMLSWVAVVAVMIVNYILLEFLNKRMILSVGKWVNRLILINIGSFVPVLYIMALYQNGPLSHAIAWTFFLSVNVLMDISLVIFFLLVTHFVFSISNVLDESTKNISH